MLTKYEFDEQSPTPGGGKLEPMFTEDQLLPPFDEYRTMFVRGLDARRRPRPSSR